MLQLMAGELQHDDLTGHDILRNVKHRNTDISCQHRVLPCLLQDMVQKGGRGALSLGPCDPHDLFPEPLDKELCLGDKPAPVNPRIFRQDDPRRLEHNVKGVQKLLVHVVLPGVEVDPVPASLL